MHRNTTASWVYAALILLQLSLHAQPADNANEKNLLSVFPPGTFFVVSLSPSGLLDMPLVAQTPLPSIMDTYVQSLGLAPADIVRAYNVICLGDDETPLHRIHVFRLRSKLNVSNIAAAFPDTQHEPIRDRVLPAVRLTKSEDPAWRRVIAALDERTFWISSEALFEASAYEDLDATSLHWLDDNTSTLSIAADLERGRAELYQWLETVPPQLAAARALLDELHYLSVHVDYGQRPNIGLLLAPLDLATTGLLSARLEHQLQQFKHAWRLVTSRFRSVLPSLGELAARLETELTTAESSVSIKLYLTGSDQELHENLTRLNSLLIKKQEENAKLAPLKKIGLALHNFEGKHRRFPPAAEDSLFDKNGVPNMSWRVHLLPFLGHANVYNNLHLDERWDSPHNLPILEGCPNEFALPGEDPQSKLTPYRAFSGVSGFISRKAGRRMGQLTDGTTNTICVVQVGNEQQVTWYKPNNDIPSESDELTDLIGDTESSGVPVLFADGSARVVKPGLGIDTWRALASVDGGEVIRMDNILMAETPNLLEQMGKILQLAD
ncbi:MAG: DUF1559 domain-containing protein [Pirellulaceae bacterium]